MSAESLLTKALNASGTDQEFNTEYLLCPEVDSAFGTITDWTFSSGTWTDEQQKERIWANLQLRWEIDSQEAREAIKRDKVIVSQPIMLSITDDGELDKDNNQQLARLMKMFSIKASDHRQLKDLFDAFRHQTGYVKVKQRGLTNKAKEPLLDSEGNQKIVAEVVAVSLEASV